MHLSLASPFALTSCSMLRWLQLRSVWSGLPHRSSDNPLQTTERIQFHAQVQLPHRRTGTAGACPWPLVPCHSSFPPFKQKHQHQTDRCQQHRHTDRLDHINTLFRKTMYIYFCHSSHSALSSFISFFYFEPQQFKSTAVSLSQVTLCNLLTAPDGRRYRYLANALGTHIVMYLLLTIYLPTMIK